MGGDFFNRKKTSLWVLRFRHPLRGLLLRGPGAWLVLPAEAKGSISFALLLLAGGLGGGFLLTDKKAPLCLGTVFPPPRRGFLLRRPGAWCYGEAGFFLAVGV